MPNTASSAGFNRDVGPTSIFRQELDDEKVFISVNSIGKRENTFRSRKVSFAYGRYFILAKAGRRFV
jgi:hypothetical protein